MVLWSMASGITTIPSQVTSYREKRFLHLSKYVPAFAIIYMNREKKNKTKQIGIFKFRIIYLELLQSHWEKQQVNWTHKFFNWFAWICSHSKSQICFFFPYFISHILFSLLKSAAAAAKSLQSCLTLCDPIDGSPPGSTVTGILQATA